MRRILVFVLLASVALSTAVAIGGHPAVQGMGMAFPTAYTRAAGRVYVASDTGDLGFRVVDATTLEGEGWATGTYRRR